MTKKVISVLGDYYHDDHGLYKTVSEVMQPLAPEMEYQDITVDQLGDILSKKPDLVILCKENRLNPQDAQVEHWMTPEMEKLIAEYVSSGGSWIAWHAGMASYTEEGLYTEMLRGYFKFHPNVNQMVSYTSGDIGIITDKPVTFEVMDEHYFVECDTANTHVFLFAKSIDGESVAGWAHQVGEGRVCCLTPTHRSEGLSNPEMRRLLKECIRWCCRKR